MSDENWVTTSSGAAAVQPGARISLSTRVPYQTVGCVISTDFCAEMSAGQAPEQT